MMEFELVDTDLSPFLAEGGKVSSDVELTRYLFARTKVQQKIDDLKASAKEFAAHFKEEIAKAEKALEFIEAPMLGYVKETGKRSLPLGTVYASSRTGYEVIDEENFAEWARLNNCVRVKVEPDKTKAIALWKDGVAIPDSVQPKVTESLNVRKK